MLVVGLAGPLTMPPMMGALPNSVPEYRAGTASGVFNTSCQIGGPLAIAVFGALLADAGAFQQGLRAVCCSRRWSQSLPRRPVCYCQSRGPRRRPELARNKGISELGKLASKEVRNHVVLRAVLFQRWLEKPCP